LLVLLALSLTAVHAADQFVSGSVIGPDGNAIAGAVVFVQTPPSASGIKPRTTAVVD